MRGPDTPAYPGTDPQVEGVLRSLTNQPPNDDQIDRIGAVRAVGKHLAETIGNNVAGGRERSLAFTHLEETVMWAVKGIVLEDS